MTCFGCGGVSNKEKAAARSQVDSDLSRVENNKDKVEAVKSRQARMVS